MKQKNKTLCLLANSKVGDLYGKKILQMLKNEFNVTNLNLIGNCGEHLKNDFQMDSIIDMEDFREKVLHLWRYQTKNIQSMKYSNLNLYQHVMMRTNQNILNLLKDFNIYEQIVSTRPSCILALDNEHLSQNMIYELNSQYNYLYGNIKTRPDSFLLTNTVRHWDHFYTYHCDHAFYTLSLPIINKRHFVFPSNYIGQYGAYDALSHLFVSSGIFREMVNGDRSITLNSRFLFSDIEKARKVVSERFRKQHNIEEDDTVVFLAPGDTIIENDYCLDAFRMGYNEFIYKYSYPTSLSFYAPNKNKFRLVISLHKGTKSDQHIRSFISQNDFSTDVIIVTNENNEHFDAMSAADFGMVYNGQMLSSAAALHLNICTMQNMNDLHYYWHTWENRWLADINLNADRPAVKEFAAGEFWKGKICNELSEMHTKPDMRWDQVRELKPFISDMLPFNRHVEIGKENNFVCENYGEMYEYEEYNNPIYVIASRVNNSLETYSFTNKIDIHPKELNLRIPSLKEESSSI